MLDSGGENRLASEESLYLRMHANNPIDWYPWSAEAFELARERGCPVFVSIGYSACHWCHVMAHESFEDAEVAEYVNHHYVCVKVDREERPDVDAYCMDVCQQLTGHGGWPLTVVMDGERRPFFAGTYFPRHTRQGRLGFLDLMKRLRAVWDEDHERVMQTAAEIMHGLRQHASRSMFGEISENIFDRIDDDHRRMFDNQYGGFSIAPKFPSPHHLLLLFRRYHQTRDAGLLSMACATLDAMRAGGLYDHVGGGFHRYSTDREWLLPHFEKMLPDQAMLMMAYSEAWLITRDPLYRATVLDVAAFVGRELVLSDGRFASAQDADTDGEEGQFYVWEQDELSFLSQELRDLLGVVGTGNYKDEATGNQMPTNILHATPTTVRELTTNSEWLEQRGRLYEYRNRRTRPLTDDKALADWNGLMIGALARASRNLGAPELLDLARAAYDSWPMPPAFHRSRSGNDAVPAMLDDLAMMGWAAIELYQCSGEQRLLDDAIATAQEILSRFEQNGSLVLTAENVTDVPVRQRLGYDGAYPSGNSMAAELFLAVGAITADDVLLDAARRCVTSIQAMVEASPSAFCMLLCTWHTIVCGWASVSVSGCDTSSDWHEIWSLVTQEYHPRAYVKPLASASGDTAHVIVCTATECSAPLRDLEVIRMALQ